MTSTVTAPIDECDHCGFGWDRYSDEQAVGALILPGAFFRGVLAGIDLDVANTRPDEDTWSVLEYVDHVRRSTWVWRFVVEVAVAGLDVDLSNPTATDAIDSEAPRFDDVEATIAAMEAETTELFSLFLELTPDQWDITSDVDTGRVDQHWIVRHVLHEVLHHLHDVGRIRVRLGDGVPTQTGSVVQLNLGGGGVPKHPVDEAEVTGLGMAGDNQNDRIHHGRPFQALCLYSQEVIEALNAEGHPINAGAAGENITVQGIEWARLRPGTVMAIGDQVQVEVSSYATPCAKNAQWFSDGNFRRMLQDHRPGWSRLYATVLRPGSVHAGDPVVVEP